MAISYVQTPRGYPAKRALSAMHKHDGWGPFGRIPSTCVIYYIFMYPIAIYHISFSRKFVFQQFCLQLFCEFNVFSRDNARMYLYASTNEVDILL